MLSWIEQLICVYKTNRFVGFNILPDLATYKSNLFDKSVVLSFSSLLWIGITSGFFQKNFWQFKYQTERKKLEKLSPIPKKFSNGSNNDVCIWTRFIWFCFDSFLFPLIVCLNFRKWSHSVSTVIIFFFCFDLYSASFLATRKF